MAGLDYAGCRAAAEGMGIDWAAEFGRLRTMEAAALEALAERDADPAVSPGGP